MPFWCRNVTLNFLLLVTFVIPTLFYFILIEVEKAKHKILVNHERDVEVGNLKQKGNGRIMEIDDDFEPNPFLRKWRNMPCRTCGLPNLDFLTSGPNRCKQKDVELLFMINSKSGNFLKRKTIRETWANKQEMNTYSMDYIFLIGTTYVNQDHDLIQCETRLFDDIIQVNILDTYANLTLKTLAGFKWVSLNCKRAQIIFKTDDDMWINLDVLNKPIDSNRMDSQAIYGNCFGSGYPHRNPRCKWYTPYRFYPYRWYPSFCLGSAFIMKNTTVQRLWGSSQAVPFFHLEDVYISGLVAQVSGIKRIPTSSLKLDPSDEIKEETYRKKVSSKVLLLKDSKTVNKIRIKQEYCKFPL